LFVAIAVPVLGGKMLSSQSIVTFAGQVMTGARVEVIVLLQTLLHPFISVIVTE